MLDHEGREEHEVFQCVFLPVGTFYRQKAPADDRERGEGSKETYAGHPPYTSRPDDRLPTDRRNTDQRALTVLPLSCKPARDLSDRDKEAHRLTEKTLCSHACQEARCEGRRSLSRLNEGAVALHGRRQWVWAKPRFGEAALILHGEPQDLCFLDRPLGGRDDKVADATLLDLGGPAYKG